MSKNPNSPDLIPDQLLAEIKKGDCVLFFGADLPLNYPGAPLSRPELATALAQKYGLPPDRPWPDTAQAYLAQQTGDRHGLISFVAEHCTGPHIAPGPLHQAIARVGFRAIVTAWYDELLEEALRQVGYRVNRVVRDTQLAYAGAGERETIVIKLFGCLSDPESLVLTTQDQARLMARLSRKLQFVTAFCSMRPSLFVGFDLADFLPLQLYTQATLDLADHIRRAYALWPTDPAAMQAAWQGMNVEFRQAEAAPFLEALAQQLPAIGPAGRQAIRVNRPPYKFLDYYDTQDADIFCGRDTESQVVTHLALSYRLLTLFGPSGAGKTSLLLAGMLPRLHANGYRHVYVRALDDPLPALRRAIADLTGRNDWQTGPDLRAFLSAMLAPEDKLVIILDQFEEFFLRVGSANRTAFFTELAAALTEPAREVRVILSLREDYLPYLDEARPYFPRVLSDSHRLTELERRNARAAITEPAIRAGMTVEPALVDALVGAEGHRNVTNKILTGDLVEEDSHVPPTALQIVLNRLYRDALPPSHPSTEPPPSGTTLRYAAYQAIERQVDNGDQTEVLRGAEAILAGYVDEGLAHLPHLRQADDSPLQADPALGEAILKVMVTSQATKAALTQAEILDGLDEAGLVNAADPADRRLVEQTRLGLERVRLVRGFERDGAALYEPAHDYLAAAIARRLDEAELATKLAREMLRREMDNWRGSGLLIRPEILALIDEQRAGLKRLQPAELELLFRSALAIGYEVPYWFERAQAAGVAVIEIALTGLQAENFRTRAAAVNALGQLGADFMDSITAMLADKYPQVRLAAIRALERLDPSGRWRQHLKYECYVLEGEFIMGDDNGNDDEKPAHPVQVAAFYCGKYPVTNADYQRYQADLGRAFEIPAGKADHPVVEISWYDAYDYAAWSGMRLLTEAEWEKAASWEPGGKKRQYPWGPEFDKTRCNTEESGIDDTTPVGKYSPVGDSPYGCADMAGNVWEWTSNLYKKYPYNIEDWWENMSSDESLVLRGGSLFNKGRSAQTTSRFTSDPYIRVRHFGVRVGVAAAPFSNQPSNDDTHPQDDAGK